MGTLGAVEDEGRLASLLFFGTGIHLAGGHLVSGIRVCRRDLLSI